MDSQTTQIILNKNKRIGNVLFIVEGEKTEPNILCKIFEKIFGYRYTRIYRNGKKPYDKLSSSDDKSSRVYVINAQESNIANISGKNQYLNDIFTMLIEEYNIDFENMAIFYIWDRDYHSNTDVELIIDLLNNLGNSRDSFEFERQGLLLLSYPAIEAYTATNFIDGCFGMRFNKGKELKQYLDENKIYQQNISVDTITKACIQLISSLSKLGIEAYNLDDMRDTNTAVFEKQELDFAKNKNYRLLSMFSIALLDLGLLTMVEV